MHLIKTCNVSIWSFTDLPTDVKSSRVGLVVGIVIIIIFNRDNQALSVQAFQNIIGTFKFSTRKMMIVHKKEIKVTVHFDAKHALLGRHMDGAENSDRISKDSV